VLKGDIEKEIESLGGHNGLVGLVDLLHKQVRKVRQGCSEATASRASFSPLPNPKTNNLLLVASLLASL